jgi:hypothetical protein
MIHNGLFINVPCRMCSMLHRRLPQFASDERKEIFGAVRSCVSVLRASRRDLARVLGSHGANVLRGMSAQGDSEPVIAGDPPLAPAISH